MKMNTQVEILTKVYGYVNRIKIALSFDNTPGVWDVVNGLSDYLVSVDVGGNEADNAENIRLAQSLGLPPELITERPLSSKDIAP